MDWYKMSSLDARHGARFKAAIDFEFYNYI